jgi:hypothetical protein
VQLAKEPTYQVGFFVPENLVFSPKNHSFGDRREADKFNHLKATTRSATGATRILRVLDLCSTALGPYKRTRLAARMRCKHVCRQACEQRDR